MKTVFLSILVIMLGMVMPVPDADARRLGGGKNMGSSAPAQSGQQALPKPMPQQQAQSAQPLNPQAAASRPGGASRWLGPLAGLAAGGLLASLFFGDAFEGFQIMDFLLLAALVIGGVMLFRALRAKRAVSGPQPAAATAGSAGAGAGPASVPYAFETPAIGSGLGGHPGAAATAGLRPAWFNEQEFLRAAKTHFIRLQAAWDAGDMKDIREYTTPELFAELTLERQSYQGEPQFTEIVSLDAELLDLVTESDKVVASVRYSGLIREEQGAEAHPFSETWYVERALSDPQADWYVAGIRQQEPASA